LFRHFFARAGEVRLWIENAGDWRVMEVSSSDVMAVSSPSISYGGAGLALVWRKSLSSWVRFLKEGFTGAGDVHEAKTQLSRLLELVEQGETVTIARHGKPVAELIRAVRGGLPLGVAREEPLVPPGDSWWAPFKDDEAEGWIEER
jgi:prevent-host-death family protein